MVNTLIPVVIYSVVAVLGFMLDALIVIGTIVGKTDKKDLMVFLAGILMIFVGLIGAFNIPVEGPYFEHPESGKIYIVEDTFKLHDKYAVGLTEWSLITKNIVPKTEILNSSEDEPSFKPGDCVSLQDKELKTIKIQGCGNNS